MDAQSVRNGDGTQNRDSEGSPESVWLGAALPTVPDRVKAADPTTYITPDDPPMLLEHGTADSVIPYQQSVVFADALKAKLGPDGVTLRLIRGAEHVDPAFVTPENIAFVLDWIDAKVR